MIVRLVFFLTRAVGYPFALQPLQVVAKIDILPKLLAGLKGWLTYSRTPTSPPPAPNAMHCASMLVLDPNALLPSFHRYPSADPRKHDLLKVG